METFRPRKSQLSDRFLAPFSSLDPATTDSAGGGEGGELDEGEMFWIESGNSSNTHSSPPKTSPAPLTRSHSETLHCIPSEKNFGILAVLPEDDAKKSTAVQRPGLLQRKSSLPSPSSTSSESLLSVKMLIPKPKPKPKRWDWDRWEHEGKRPIQQSAPVDIMMAQRRKMKDWREEIEDGKMLPPHEMVARFSSKESPMTTFSVLEGVGRTLKGRDLRRVRNAVWRQTGFLD